MKFFRNEKIFFKKYCILILILNFVVLAISLILYPLLFIGIIVPIFGNIFGVLFLCIYNVLNNFAKLHNDLISSDGNLNFLKNFINPLWNFLKSSKKVLCVTSFRIFFQNHSIGFKSGEYGGKNINSNSSLWASKNGFNSLERWARALSNIKSIFPASRYRVRIPSKKCWNCSAFNVSENAIWTLPTRGSTAPTRC